MPDLKRRSVFGGLAGDLLDVTVVVRPKARIHVDLDADNRVQWDVPTTTSPTRRPG